MRGPLKILSRATSWPAGLVLSSVAPGDHGRELVPSAFQRSLSELGMDYVDMYMIHFPGSAKISSSSPKNITLRDESWRAMEMLYDQGLVKSIGVCNFTETHLLQLLSKHSNMPVVNQVEYHPYYPQRDLLKFCNSQNIVLQAYCSFGGTSAGSNELMTNPIVKRIAAKYQASSAQILLLWALQHGVAVIPKSTNPAHIRDNINFNVRLSQEDIAELGSIDISKKYTWDPSIVL